MAISRLASTRGLPDLDMEIDLESFAVAVKGIWYIGFTAVEPFEWETFCLAYSPNHTVTMAYKVTQVLINDEKISVVNL